MQINLCTTKRNFIGALFKVVVPEIRHNFIVRLYYSLITHLHKTRRLFGAYYPIKGAIFVNLERFNESIPKNKMVYEICDTITHECLHYAIDMCAGKHYRKLKYSETNKIKSAEHKIIDLLMKNGGKKQNRVD